MNYAEKLDKLVKVLEHGFASKFELKYGLSNSYASKKPATPWMATYNR